METPVELRPASTWTWKLEILLVTSAKVSWGRRYRRISTLVILAVLQALQGLMGSIDFTKMEVLEDIGHSALLQVGNSICFKMEPQLSFSNIMFILWEWHLHSVKTNNQGYRNTLLITWEQCCSDLWRWTSKNTSSHWVQHLCFVKANNP